MDYRYIPFYVQGNAISGLYYGQWEMSEDRDMDYVREMYPMTFSRFQELVEKECNRQEFAGSMMYDEYPDQLQLRLLCRRIYDKAKEGEENPGTWLSDLIQVMAYQELCQRRRDHRTRRRKYYGLI